MAAVTQKSGEKVSIMVGEATPLIDPNQRSLRSQNSMAGCFDGKINEIPLQGQRDFLAGAIFENCIANSPLLDNHCCSRTTALAISITTSLSAGVSFIPVSLPLPVGALFAAANLVGYFKLDMWAIRATINDLLGPKVEKEILLLERAANGKCSTVAAITAATAIALLSQTPFALPVLDYDGNLKIPAVICLFIGGALIPIRSLQLTIDKTIRTKKNTLGEAGKKLENLRTVMVSLIDQHREIFRKMDRSSQLTHIDRLNQVQGTDLQKTREFVEEILKDPLAVHEIQERSVLAHCSRSVGFLIAGSLQAGLAIYTFEKAKQHVFDNEFVAGFLACSVVLSGIYLSGLSIINTTERISRSFQNFITGQQEETIAERLRPKLTQSLKLLGLIIDLGALGAATVIWGDFYKDNLPAKIYFEISICLAYFLFLSTSTLDMVDEVVEEIALRRGHYEERQIVQLNNKLKKMEKLIEQSSILDFSVFLGIFSENVKTRLLSRVNLTIENLEKSIRQEDS